MPIAIAIAVPVSVPLPKSVPVTIPVSISISIFISAVKESMQTFLVGGLGLSALSKRLTSWLESHASLEDQVQVIDDGSGELTIYLIGAEKQY